MKNRIIIAIFVMITLTFMGCMGSAKETVHTDNGDYNVSLLFTIDGCKMYRFRDGSKYHYFSKCDCDSSVEYTTKEGKREVTNKIDTSNEKN